jgi:hypothetical protein
MRFRSISFMVSFNRSENSTYKEWAHLLLKGDGTSVAVLHLYDSFHQKCSKLGTVTTLGLKRKFKSSTALRN